MSTMVPMYGFGGGGGTGAALTVTAPAGCTVTVSKDGKTKSKVAGTDGVAVFRGLATGQWTVTITDGEQTAQKTVTITADYSAAITFFAATIRVTYPSGSVCTATDGTTTLTAPDTSGTWDCAVPNAGTWTVSCTDGSHTASKTVSITAYGRSESVTLSYNFVILRDGEYVATRFVMLDGSVDDGLRDDGSGRSFSRGYSQFGALEMRTEGKIPADIKTIKIVGRMVSGTFGTDYYHTFFVSESGTWPDAYNNRLASLSPFTELSSTNKEYSFDISNINKDVYLWYAGACGNAGQTVAIVIDDLEGVGA